MSAHRRNALDLRPMPKHREGRGHRVAMITALGCLLALALMMVTGVIP